MTATSEERAPFILVRTQDDEVAALGSEALPGWFPIASTVLKGLFSSSGTSGQVYGRYFTMKPSDLGAWDSLTHHGPGDGYSYAVGWNGSGKVGKVFSVKEAAPPAQAVPGIDPVLLANAAALAQVQASIDRLTDLLEKVSLDVRQILTFLHHEQQASILAAVETVDQVYEANRLDWAIGVVDWSRVVGLEQVIKQQHRQVLLELGEIAQDLEFHDIAAAERSMTRRPERVRHLVALEYYLLRALNRWTALMLASKQRQGEMTREDIAAARDTLERYTEHAHAMLKAIRKSDSRHIKGRNFFEMLFSDGLVVGARKDDFTERKAKENRTAVQAEAKDHTLRQVITKNPRLTIAA